MKRTTLVAAVLFAALTLSLPAMPSPSMPDPADQVALWDEQLDLDAGQQQHFLEVLTAFADDMETRMSTGQRPRMRDLRALMDERNDALKTVLDGDQLEAFDEASDQMMKEARRRR